MQINFKVTAANIDYMIDVLKNAYDEARNDTDEVRIDFDNVHDVFIDTRGGN